MIPARLPTFSLRLAATLLLLPGSAAAQARGSAAAALPTRVAPADTSPPADTVPVGLSVATGGLVLPGSMAEERLRVLQLLGQAPTEGFLVRTPAVLTESAEGGHLDGLLLRWVAPRVDWVYNSRLPFSLNDGPMWAGRGSNLLVTGGVRLTTPRVTLVLAPQLVYSSNERFDVINYTGDDRSPFASPWHENPESADLPLRFGTESLSRLVPGQSRLAFRAGAAEIGASTENQWWGPGVRNAIVMSSHAEGIPRLFLRTARPLRTGVGAWEAEWMIGALSESAFFDTIPGNDTRSLSGLAVTFAPAAAPGLTLGLTRAVYVPSDGSGDVLGSLFDVFTDVGTPNSLPPSFSERQPGPDQIFSLFGRWVAPADGFEVYGEWARHERPRGIGDLLAAPNHTQGYTVGLQWARPFQTTSVLRIGAEATNLEQSATYRQRNVASYYTSRAVLQGYTQRGQVIGASIGPGSSAQSFAADWLAPRWSAGIFGGRIRWENDEHYRQRPGGPFLDVGHDVSLLGGLRGTGQMGRAQVRLELTSSTRYNYLFQYQTNSQSVPRGNDVDNLTLRLTVAPFGGV